MDFIQLLEKLLGRAINLDPKTAADQEQIKHLYNIATNLVTPCMDAIALSIPYAMKFYGHFSFIAGKTVPNNTKLDKARDKARPGILKLKERGKFDALAVVQDKMNLIEPNALRPYYCMIEYIKIAISVLKDKNYNTKIQMFLFQGGKREVENEKRNLKKGEQVSPLLLSPFTYQQKTTSPAIANAKLIDVLLTEKELRDFITSKFSATGTATNPQAAAAAAATIADALFGDKTLREYIATALKSASSIQTTTAAAAGAISTAPSTADTKARAEDASKGTDAAAKPNHAAGLATAFAAAAQASMVGTVGTIPTSPANGSGTTVAAATDKALATDQPILQFTGSNNTQAVLTAGTGTDAVPASKPLSNISLT